MAKIIRNISLDMELDQQLKNHPNASALICKLLDDYFNGRKYANWPIDKLEELKELNDRKKAIEQEMRELEAKYG